MKVSLPPALSGFTCWSIIKYCGPFITGDLTGQVLAYISLLPIAILVGFVTLIVFKRELHTVSSVHAPLVWFLKSTIIYSQSIIVSKPQ